MTPTLRRTYQTGTRLLVLAMLVGLAACGSGGGSTGSADGEEYTAENLPDKACEDGGLVVYESTPGDAMQQVLAAFKDAYPCMGDLAHVRVPGQEVGPRIQQESLARVETADVAMSGPDTPAHLNEDGLLATTDWASLDLPEELVEEPYAVPTVTTPFVIVYNTDLVSADEAPATWDDLLDPAWNGKMIAWSRPTPFAQLSTVWDKDRTVQYMQDLLGNGIALQDDSAHVVQTVGSGEYEAGITQYNHAARAQQSGAPVEIVVPPELPADTLYTYIPKDAPHPAAARLFIGWLNGPEGSVAYEEATLRGNGLIEGTKTHELTQQGTLATHHLADVDDLEVKIEEFGGIWTTRGQGGS